MGDRCYLTLRFRKADSKAFTKEFMYSPEEWAEEVHLDENGIMEVSITEANYALYREFQNLAEAKIPFIVTHTAGDAYGPGEMVSDGEGNFSGVVVGHEGGGYVAAIKLNRETEVLELDERDLDDLRAHLKILDRVEKMLGVL